LDLVLGVVELIEGAIPGIQLPGMDADPPPLVPVREEASAPTITDEITFEPAGQSVLAGRSDQAIGDEHEGAVSKGNAFGFADPGVEDGPEPQLVEQGSEDQDRSPVGG